MTNSAIINQTKKSDKFKSLLSRCKTNIPPSQQEIANLNTAQLNEFNSNMLGKQHIDKDMLIQAADSTIAHVKMMRKRKVMDEISAEQLLDILPQIKQNIAAEGLPNILNSEIYSAQVIKRLVSDKSAKAAADLNIDNNMADYANGDLKAYVLQQYYLIQKNLIMLHDEVVKQAEKNVKYLLPTIFNASIVQATSIGHYLMSYCRSMQTNVQRINSMMEIANSGPYGVYNGAGTSFNINRDMMNRNMGFAHSEDNSHFAISNRMYTADFLYVCAAIASDISKLAADLIDWSAHQNQYIEFSPKAFNSNEIQPKRRDASSLQIIRGIASVINGHLNATLTLQNNNSNAYGSDLELIASGVTTSAQRLNAALKAALCAISNFTVNKNKAKEVSSAEHALANDLYEWLINNTKNDPEQAHKITANIVKSSIKNNKKLSLITLKELQKHCPDITRDVYSALIASRAVIARRSFGASNLVQVRKNIRHARKAFDSKAAK